jgi:peroxiredoxin
MNTFTVKTLSLLGWFWLLPMGVVYSAPVPQQLTGVDLVSAKSLKVLIKEAPKATVVVFLSSRCPCSASHHTVLNQLFQKFKDQGVKFVGVHSNANEEFDEAREFFSAAKFSFPILNDPRSEIANQLEAFKTPHVFLINPRLEILFQGGVDNSKVAEKATQHFLREALEALVAGQPIPLKNARVVGCQIQRP